MDLNNSADEFTDDSSDVCNESSVESTKESTESSDVFSDEYTDEFSDKLPFRLSTRFSMRTLLGTGNKEKLRKYLLDNNIRNVEKIIRGEFTDTESESTSESYPSINMSPPKPIRLCRVQGSLNRYNDVVYASPWSADDDNDEAPGTGRPASELVIFFGGDIQDFRHELEKYPNFMDLWNWSLEDAASILQTRFQNHHILVIRPVRYCAHISCFDNFVYSNNSLGVPFIDVQHNGLQHLLALLKEVSVRLTWRKLNSDSESSRCSTDEDGPDKKDKSETEQLEVPGCPKDVNDPRIICRLDLCNITLVGFSKGCAVLNQLVAELNYYKNDTQHDLGKFVTLVTDIYWLDSGHEGHKSAWVTTEEQVETLKELGIAVHIHVTPYQMRNPKKKWLVNEERTFRDLLATHEVIHDEHKHFFDEERSLKNHFKLLSDFKRPPSSLASTISGSMDL